MTKGILHGIRVLDLSRMLSGPYCTMMLADHGAEVIKIESADDDPDRKRARFSASRDRSKKSVKLDLNTDEGKAAFRALAATADVVVENFQPGVMERLDLSYESLAETNPALVYAAIRGFADPRSGKSPCADGPVHDGVAQAMGGDMSLAGPDAALPARVGPGVPETFAGLMMSFGIMAALRQAEATGRGQFVDVAICDAMMSLCEHAFCLHDLTAETPGPEGHGHPSHAPLGLLEAQDGAVASGIVDETFRRAFVEVMAQARLADPKVARSGRLADEPHPAPGREPWKVATNPLRFSAFPAPAPHTPPDIGADTDTYLSEMPPRPMSDADKRSLRNAFGAFATGVTVVTTRQPDGTPRGFTANSFSSVSLDPPLLLLCIAKTAHSCATFVEAPFFAINVLSEDQRPVSGLFASQAQDKFDQTPWHPGTAGMPLLDGALAAIVCSREKIVDAGDHVILLGRVIDHQTRDAKPLGYFKGNYFSIGLEDELVSAASKAGALQIGALVMRGKQILLAVGPGGQIAVPKAASARQNLPALKAHLEKLGVKAQLDFLYAVYHDTTQGHHGIYYHGTAVGLAPPGHKFFDLEDIPLSKVQDPAERSMLARYYEEFRHGSFGIYQGDETSGIVHKVSAPETSRY